jgi:hypothetical protein
MVARLRQFCGIVAVIACLSALAAAVVPAAPHHDNFVCLCVDGTASKACVMKGSHPLGTCYTDIKYHCPKNYACIWRTP